MTVSRITSVNMAGGAAPVPAAVSRPAVQGAKEAGRATGAEKLRQDNETRTRQQDEKKAEQRKEDLKDLIAVSKDGDTAQASADAKELLSEDRFGSVRKLGEDEKKNPAEEIQDRNPAAEEASAAEKLAEEKPERKSPAEEEKRTGEELAEAARKADEERAAERRARIEAQMQEARAEEKAERKESNEKAGDLAEENSAINPAAGGNEAKIPAEETKGQNITSLKGYTEKQLEQLYQQGEISKTDYDKEIQSRKEIRGDREEQDREFAENTVRGIGLQEKAERDEQELKNAFDEDASDNLTPGDRIAMINAADEMTK